MDSKLARLTRGGLLLALVALLTAYVKIPVPMIGYYHVGDGAVILSGLALGPFGALPAAIGSVVADLLSGFPFYAPFSFVIKGFMAFGAGKWLRGRDGITVRNLVVLLGLFLVMPILYFPADWIAYGVDAALFAVLGNLLQGGIGYAISVMLLGTGLFRRSK